MGSQKCQICGSDEWKILPDPGQYQSVTTAGRIVNQVLGKSQCAKCGFLQRVRAEFLGFTDYYEQDYANYYDRPGTEEFHKKRYRAIIDWMSSCIVDDFDFKTVLDVGCGQGWAMEAMKIKFPDKVISGIEPSLYNVRIAKSKGFEVMLGKMEDLHPAKKFDFIFSNNVIQHVNDAKRFLTGLAERLNDQGVIIVTCPDGAKPNIELLWADQNYSFLSNHLIKLGKELGFDTLYLTQSAENPSLPPAQLLLLTNNVNYKKRFEFNETGVFKNIDEVYRMRSDYLGSFDKINQYLIKEIEGFENIFNFGASYWTSVLAAYCPDYWKKVSACLVDDNDGFIEFFEKKIIKTNTANKLKSVLVLGISPASQSVVKDKFSDWSKVICWNNFISY